MIDAFFPPAEDRLVFALVTRPPHRERALRPDHRRGPVAARLGERFFERVQLRRRHADVDRAFGNGQQVRARIVADRARCSAEPTSGRAPVAAIPDCQPPIRPASIRTLLERLAPVPHGVLNICIGRCHLCVELKRPRQKAFVPPRTRSHPNPAICYKTTNFISRFKPRTPLYVLRRDLAHPAVAQRFVHLAAALCSRGGGSSFLIRGDSLAVRRKCGTALAPPDFTVCQMPAHEIFIQSHAETGRVG